MKKIIKFVKKWKYDIVLQIGVALISSSLFLDCSSFFSEKAPLIRNIRFTSCNDNEMVFVGIILISISLNIILRKKK